MTRQRRTLKPLPRERCPEALLRLEREAASSDRPRPWIVGVALSGGGIRSATFCLGVFQALARHKALDRVDYLSTVSGGGYFGSFLGRLYCRGGRAAAQEALEKPDSEPVHFLRENGRYLAPRGSGDLLRAAAVALRNWVAVHAVMLLSCAFAIAALTLVRYAVAGSGAYAALTDVLGVGPWVSPFAILALVVVVLIAVPLGWVYWLVPEGSKGGGFARGWIRGPAVLILVVLAWLGTRLPLDEPVRQALWLVVALGGVAVFFYLWVAVVAGWQSLRRKAFAGSVQLLRTHFSVGLTYALAATGVLLLISAIDSAGLWLLVRGFDRALAEVYAGAVVVMLAIRAALPLTTALKPGQARVRLPVGIVAAAVAAVLAACVLSTLDAAVHALAWWGRLGELRAYARLDVHAVPDLRPLLIATGVGGLLSWAVGQMWAFVNRSSLQALYEARLRRAYLGASNPARHRDAPDPVPLAESHPDDRIEMGKYRPEQGGGPVHLVNVTVNETIAGRSQVEQRDRKGMNMAIGPGGVSVSRSHHAAWHAREPAPLLARVAQGARDSARAFAETVGMFEPGQFSVFPCEVTPEDLELSHWVAVSGAAFSTGVGSRTSIGLSALAGIANARTGYWWHSGVEPAARKGQITPSLPRRAGLLVRRVFRVQGALWDEWLARFPGVALKRWYLSDGGYFENTAVYELIRRRLPFIVACDCGADPDYTFTDLGNLVRKARIDFEVNIEFLDGLSLGREVTDPAMQGIIGTLEQLRPVSGKGCTAPPRARAHAALARIDYPAEGRTAASTGWLLLVKPTLTGDEPADVAEYQSGNSTFPQQTTVDQFFDEAQWESYRKLGEHIAGRLFDPAATQGWTPAGQM